MTAPSARWGSMTKGEKELWLLCALGFSRLKRKHFPREWVSGIPWEETEGAAADAALGGLELTPDGAAIVDGLARLLGV
ncbi:hypothetical protein WOC76_11145 [Methylocystis sp. IM3]|uniref:hypothetical protein n=1 Tax=unclassified Methylocystis TaxID=2625913 RepID=UPI0030FC7ECE